MNLPFLSFLFFFSPRTLHGVTRIPLTFPLSPCPTPLHIHHVKFLADHVYDTVPYDPISRILSLIAVLSIKIHSPLPSLTQLKLIQTDNMITALIHSAIPASVLLSPFSDNLYNLHLPSHLFSIL